MSDIADNSEKTVSSGNSTMEQVPTRSHIRRLMRIDYLEEIGLVSIIHKRNGKRMLLCK